ARKQAMGPHVAEGLTAPQLERTLQQLHRAGRVASGDQATRLGNGRREAGEIQRFRLEREAIPAWLCLQRVRGRAESLTEPRDMHLQALRGSLGWLVRPQLVYQALAGQDLVT